MIQFASKQTLYCAVEYGRLQMASTGTTQGELWGFNSSIASLYFLNYVHVQKMLFWLCPPPRQNKS